LVNHIRDPLKKVEKLAANIGLHFCAIATNSPTNYFSTGNPMLQNFTRLLKVASFMAATFAGFAQAAPTCIPVFGFVHLDPDPACSVTTKYSGPNYLVASGAVPPAAVCFSLSIRGPIGHRLIGTGSSGLTSEGLISPLSSSASATPSVINESGVTSTADEFGLPETRRFFTARSAIDFMGGRLFTADAGILGRPDAPGSTEQLVVTGGTGPWHGATGMFYASGDSIQDWGLLYGHVCKP
jgi:hypothetical protein